MKLISLVILVALWVVPDAQAHSNGAPKNHKVCKALRPHHGGALPQKGTSPYILTATKDKVPVNTPIEVTLTSTGGATAFKGFVMQVRGVPNLTLRPLGMFVIEDEDRSKPLHCYNVNDTVTHSSPVAKRSIKFSWLPPRDLKGNVYFQASFVQVFPIYWVHVMTEVVIDSARKVDSKWLIPYPPDNPNSLHKHSKHWKNSKIQRSLYEGCGSLKKCFGMPAVCVSQGSCDAVMSVVEQDGKFEFEMIAKNSDYVAVSLSESKDISKNSITECLLINNEIKLYHSPKYSNDQEQYQLLNAYSDVILLNTSYIEGTIYCKFSRNQTIDFNGVRYDLKTTKYFVTLAMGNIKKGNNNKVMSFDNIKFKAYDKNMNLSDVNDPVLFDKKLNKTTQESYSLGSFILNFYSFFVRLI